MKITIELNLEKEDDAVKYKRFVNSAALVSIVDTVVSNLRGATKYGICKESGLTDKSTIHDVNDYILQLLHDHAIVLSDLY